jgi:hypothetical protein
MLKSLVSIFSDYHFQFLKTLLNRGVKFLILGGQAAIYYGVRRGTGDLDILIERSEENGNKILLAFSDLGLAADGITAEEFNNEIFLGLGIEPDAVDLFNSTPGIDFATAYERSTVVNDRGFDINIISVTDLIRNKESLRREGEKKLLDQYDVEVLKRIMKK